MRFPLAWLLLLVPAVASAQNMYKCKNAAGKITYTNQACESVGLKSAGEVAERMAVTPIVVPQAPPTTPGAANPPADRQADAPADPKAAAPPAPEPERRCFKTAKGTRCNDAPQ
ncbi:MAG: DUF4124 domain-containing protein [Burkholderiales bacterium]